MTARHRLRPTAGPLSPAAIVTVAVVVMTGCNRAPTPQEFQKLAVTALTNEAVANGTTLRDIACDRPGNIQVGTVFTCTAVGETGEHFTFDALIDSTNHVALTPGQ